MSELKECPQCKEEVERLYRGFCCSRCRDIYEYEEDITSLKAENERLKKENKVYKTALERIENTPINLYLSKDEDLEHFKDIARKSLFRGIEINLQEKGNERKRIIK